MLVKVYHRPFTTFYHDATEKDKKKGETTMAAIEPIIYSAIEVSKVLRTRPEIIYKRLERGEIPGYREGGNWKIPKDLLRVHIENVAIKEAKERRKLHE